MNIETMRDAFRLCNVAASGRSLGKSERSKIADGFAFFAAWCHAAQVKAGWWTDPQTGLRKERNQGQLIALMHSEVSEAVEADRKNLMDDKLPLRKGVEVEIGDMLIRLGDFVGSLRPGETELFGRHVASIFSDAGGELPSGPNSDPFAEIHRRLSNAYNYVVVPSGTLGTSDSMIVFYLAKAVRTAFDLAASRGLDLIGAVEEKAAFNAKRPDHRLENRKLEGGKAY